jgi:molybdopterin-synthase adenylyltransferase
MNREFHYETAFSRNIGWLTSSEQQRLRSKTVAIAGMGGVGGSHLLTLVRLGVERFRLADFDYFELENFNRQAGASMETLGKSKVEVMATQARSINPNVALEVFSCAIDESNVSRFLTGADVFVDGLDFFAFGARETVFGFCHEKGIPAVTVAPLGMSAALLNFIPGGVSFEDYFRLSGQSDGEKAVRFLVGLAPALLHRRYLVDPGEVDLMRGKGPSTAISCQLCSGIAAAEALKILLGRGKVHAAPHGIQVDAYTNKVIHTWRPMGSRHPLNRIAINLAKRKLGIP